MSSPTAASRKLGFFETFAASVPSCVVCMVAHLTDDSDRLDQEEAFYSAIHATCRRHPNLYSLLDDDNNKGGGLSLKVYPDLIDTAKTKNHAEIITATDGNGWKDIAHRESNQEFDLKGPKPYWNVVLIHEKDHDVLIVKYHHCIADGSSGYILINDILRFYHKYANGETVVEEEEDVLPVLASVDEMCFPNGRTSEEEEFVKEGVEKLRRRKHQWVPTLKFSPTSQAPNSAAAKDDESHEEHGILYRDGTKTQLEALLAKCRQEQVTIGSVLVAATYFAVAKMYYKPQDQQAERPFALDFDMDVNLRKRFATSLGNDHVGAYIGMMAFHLTVTPATAFWDFCKTVKAAIHKGLEEKHHFHYLEIHKRLGEQQEQEEKESLEKEVKEHTHYHETLENKYDKDWKELSDKEREAALALGHEELSWNQHGHEQDMNFSNIGRYFYPPTVADSKLSVEKIYCVGGGWCPTFGSYVFLIPSVHYLNYSLVYKMSALNEAVANQFFALVTDLTERSSSLPATFTLAEYMSKE